MSLYYRLKWRLGYDTTAWVEEFEKPIYHYKITHLNGDTTELKAHGYKTEGAFAKFYHSVGVECHNLVGWKAYPAGNKVVRVLEGIKEIEKIRLGVTKHRAKIDKADGQTVETELVNPIE